MAQTQNTFIVREEVLQKNFDAFSRLANVCYPLKTNSSPPVLNILKDKIENGENYFSISSLKHFDKLANLQVNPDKIILINTIASNDVIKKLYDSGVRFFSFDNCETLKEFTKYAVLNSCKILFRLSVNEIFKVNSHIGASSSEIKQMLDLINGYNTQCGISFYIPKEINHKKDALKKMLKFIVKNFNNCGIKFVSIAGIKNALSIDEKIIKDIKSQLQLEKVFLEPGEYMLYGGIDLKTSIIRYRDGKKKQLILKNGIFSGMLDRVLYNKKFDIYIEENGKQIELYKNRKLGRAKIYIFGGSGDTADYLGKYYIDKNRQNLLNENNQIVIKNAGAYFEEFYIPHGDELHIKYETINVKGEKNEI